MPIVGLEAFDGEPDVCVVGAGPAGLACAFDLHDRGLQVALLEAGGSRPVPGEPDVRAAEIRYPQYHDPVEIVAACALGGTSHWWGGRCVPLDPVDFRHWPLAHEEILPWWEKAAAFLGSRGSSESAAPGAFARLRRFDALRDECFGPQLNMARRWRARITAERGPAIVLGVRVIGADLDGTRVTSLRLWARGERRSLRAGHVVLTSGGLGCLKLLLLMQRERPALFGGPGGPLGRGYMGHLAGTIASLVPADPVDVRAFTMRPLGGGVFARRRIRPLPQTVVDEKLVNIAFWLENGFSGNPEHGSATASARYLAACLMRAGRGAGALGPHFANIARAPFSAVSGLARAASLHGFARVVGRHPRITWLTPSGAGAWRLDYHAEQPSHPENRIGLADTLDSVGLPKLKIEFRMRESEIDAVLRAHELLDADLRTAGAGHLVFGGTREQCLAAIHAAARDGYHQLGGSAMSRDARDGVVDTDLRVHGLANLWVASGSVFPSGSQANPTLTIVALARRLADTLAGVHDGGAWTGIAVTPTATSRLGAPADADRGSEAGVSSASSAPDAP